MLYSLSGPAKGPRPGGPEAWKGEALDMRSRCSDRKVHAAQVPTQGQLENLRGKGGLGELSPHPVQDEVPTSALWTYRPGVSLPTQPVTQIGSGGGGGREGSWSCAGKGWRWG